MVTNQLEAESEYTGSPVWRMMNHILTMQDSLNQWRMMNHILTMQDSLNQTLIGSDGCLQAVQRQRIDYSAAILEKASELQKFDKSWKWWEPKSGEVNLAGMRIELINLFSLLLSEDLAISYEDFHTACAEDSEPKLGHEHVMDMALGDLAFLIEESFENAFTNPESKEVAGVAEHFLGQTTYNSLLMRRALHALTASVLQGVNAISTGFEEGQEEPLLDDEEDGGNEFTSASNVNWTAFWSVVYHLGMTLADVYVTYMTEAVLELFRARRNALHKHYHSQWGADEESRDSELLREYYHKFYEENGLWPSLIQVNNWLDHTYEKFLSTLE